MFVHITPALVTVSDYRDLKAAWKIYGGAFRLAHFRCETPLTPGQYRQLPKDLKEMFVEA